MADYVIDPSALIQAYVDEPLSEHVQELLEQAIDDVVLHIPEFCLVECTNILWKQVRFQGMPIETARQAVQNLSDLVMTIHPAAAYLESGLSIGLEHELAVYDAIYIALAERLQTPLITADGKQERVAIAAGVVVKPLTDFEAGH